MSQSGFVIPNQPGASYRASVNAALQALASQNAGEAEPEAKYANMWWADTANGVLKQRDASNTSWRIVAPMDASMTPTVTGDYTLLPRDYGKVLLCSGTFTLSIPPASSLGSGWMCRIKNTGTGTVTIDPNGSETIDGASARSLSVQWEEISLVCDGANFFVVSGMSGHVATLSGDYTLLSRDYGKVLLCSGTFTLSLPPASSLGSGWTCRIKNTGTGTVTIDPNGSETIDGASVRSLSVQWEEISLVCDGANFFVVSGLSGRVVTLDKLTRGTSGNVLGWGSDGNPLSMPMMGGMTQDRFYWIQDRNMGGWSGGNSSNTNLDRKFNTVQVNTIDPAITYDDGYGHIRYLPAGKYFAIGMAVAYTSGGHRLDLKQTFDNGSSNTINGMAGYNSAQGVQVTDVVMAHFEFAVGGQYNDAIQLQHYFKTTSTDGKGKAMDAGQPNVLADLKIWKLS